MENKKYDLWAAPINKLAGFMPSPVIRNLLKYLNYM